MEIQEALRALDRLLDEAKIAILSNIAEDGSPGLRWMSPTLIRGREGFLYAVTSARFPKTTQLQKQPAVTWMVQDKALSEVISVRGSMKVITDPGLQAMVQEAIGGKLQVFYKQGADPGELVVLETRIREIEQFKPMKGEKNRATFDWGSHEHD